MTLDPNSPPDVASGSELVVLNQCAIDAFERGDLAGALDYIAGACAHPEVPAKFHSNHAEILRRLGKHEAAEAAARYAIDRDPVSAVSHEALGTILFERGAWLESRTCFAAAVQIDPG